MLSLLAVCYLFLGGVGAGMCVALAVLGLRAPREWVSEKARDRECQLFAPSAEYLRLFRPAYALAFAVLALGVACLAADVGQFERLFLLFVSPTLSFIAVGAWVLAALLALTAALFFAWGPARRWPLAVVRALQGGSAAVALTVVVYTGLLLQSMPSVPLWSSPMVPVLFALSSLSGGAVLVVACAHTTGAARSFGPTVRHVMVCDVVLLAAEIVVVALFVLMGCGESAGVAATPTARALQGSFASLAAGPDAGLFWFGFVVLGLVAPLAIEALLLASERVGWDRAPQRVATLSLLVAFLVLLGGFVLRWCLVEAGAHPVLAAMGM